MLSAFATASLLDGTATATALVLVFLKTLLSLVGAVLILLIRVVLGTALLVLLI